MAMPRRRAAELSRTVARSILARGRAAQHAAALGRLATALGGSGPNVLALHLCTSPLSSASLLANRVRDAVVRGGDAFASGSTTAIKRILDIAGERHRLWEHATCQAGRLVQCRAARDALEVQAAGLACRLAFEPDNAAAAARLASTRGHLALLGALLDAPGGDDRPRLNGDTIRGSLHPEHGAAGVAPGGAILTPGERASLPSGAAALRGIRVTVRGPKRGSKAMKWERSSGRVSTNSVGVVVAEEAKVPLPTRVGTFGLTVRLVYCLARRLASPLAPIHVVGDEAFYLHSPLASRTARR